MSLLYPRCCFHLQGSHAHFPFVAAAAAKINAQLQARKGIQHVDVPPIKSSSPATKQEDEAAEAARANGEMYISDGDYIKDIEVNDLRNRYLLTKSSTQKMVNFPLVVSTDSMLYKSTLASPGVALHSVLLSIPSVRE